MFLNDIEHNWIGEIPVDWEVKRIKNVFYLKKEVSENPQDEQILSLTFGGIVKRDVSSNEGQLPETYNGYTKIYPDDIVMNPMDLRSGWIDRSKYDGIISPSYYVLNKNTDEVNIGYFNYQLQRHYKERIFFPFGQGVSYDYRWGMGRETILNFPIIVPPQETQSQIVSFLDHKTQKIDELIEKTEKKIELLKEKRTSLINEIVTGKKVKIGNAWVEPVETKDSGVEWIGEIPKDWDVKKLKYVSDIFSSSIDRHIHEDEIQVSICHYPDVYNNEFINDEIELNKGSCSEVEFQRYILKKGLVILTKDSETPDDIGNPCYVEIDFDNVVCGYHLTIIENNDIDVNSKFLFRFIQSDKVRCHFETESRGITRFSLGKSKIENLFVNLPSYPEQTQIVEYLDEQTQKIDTTIEKETQRIELLKEYRQSLISEVVTGKIDVRGWKE